VFTGGESDSQVRVPRRPETTARGKYWFKNLRLEAEGTYVRGQPQGPWRFYKESGRCIQTGSFENGVPRGEWIYFWSSNGREATRGEFTDGVQSGTWTVVGRARPPDRGRQVREGPEDRHVADVARERRPLEPRRVQGRRARRRVDVWNEDGHGRARRFVREGPRREGPWKFAAAGNKPQQQGAFRAGKEEGPWTCWHDNGTKSDGRRVQERPLRDRRVDALVRGTARRNRPASTSTASRNGPWTYWNEDGSEKERVKFENGKRAQS
jgi:antitoxin component YwqK of YwqJK toxin-antitoxin module